MSILYTIECILFHYIYSTFYKLTMYTNIVYYKFAIEIVQSKFSLTAAIYEIRVKVDFVFTLFISVDLYLYCI
jgi:hypothetical protein